MITQVIRNRFMFHPVLLSSVAKPFNGLEYLARFYELVDTFMPERKKLILKKETPDSVKEFVEQFSLRYFPIFLHTNYDGSVDLAYMVRNMPAHWYGFNPWNYEAHVYRNNYSQILACVICECPFENHSRPVLVDSFLNHIKDLSNEVTSVLPKKGYPLEDVEEAIKDAYPGLLIWCRWIFGRTGNRWLDQKDGEDNESWDKDNVLQLSREYPRYEELKKEMADFDNWLAKDFANRSVEVIKYVSARIKLMEAKLLRNKLAGARNGNRKELKTV